MVNLIYQEEQPEIQPQQIDEKELACLTMVMYYEARNQSPRGQAAVAMVVLNRIRTGMHPNTICEVVFERCQFSWVCDGAETRHHPDKNQANKRAWEEIKTLANEIIIAYNNDDEYEDVTGGATHFHASYVRPTWRKWKRMVRTIRIETHIFYKLKDINS